MEEEALEIRSQLPNFYTKRNIYVDIEGNLRKQKLTRFGLSVTVRHLEGAEERRRLERRGAEGGGAGRIRAAADGGDRRERAVVRSDREIEPRKAIVERGGEILRL